MDLLVTGMVTALATCAQTDRWPGIAVTLDEILAEVKHPPAGNREREAAWIALFRQAGAAEGEIQVLPLEPTVKPHLAAARERTAERLRETGTPPAEIELALEELDRRHRELGNNLRVVLPGRTDRVIGFAAHLDTAEGSPGAIDNWAACVLLSNLYQTLRSTRPQHTIWFCGFAEQEAGCLGSAAWADSLDARSVARIDAFVVVDCVGVAAPMAWFSGSNAAVVELAADAAQRAGLPFQAVDFPGTTSDSLCLKRRAIPVLSLLGIEPPDLKKLHGPEDLPEALDARRLGETFALLRALAAEFDTHPQPLLWDYVKAKLRIGEPASGRQPLRPTKLDLTHAPLASPPAPPEPSAPPAEKPRDGSRP